MNHDFENLENELRSALRRDPAPPDFAAKVLAAAHRTPVKVPTRSWIRRPFTLALAAGLAVAAIIPSAILEYRHRENERGLKAKQDLLLALSITQDQFRHARATMLRTTTLRTTRIPQ